MRRALHLYTGEGYGLVTTSILNDLHQRGFAAFVVHLGDQNVRFDYQQSTSDRTRIINQSISDLEDFLSEWQDSEVNLRDLYVSVPLLHNNTATTENADDFYSDYVDYMGQVEDTVIGTLGRVRNTHEKEFMWCPYYGYGTYMDNIIYNRGVVANRTNIFDIICIQPAYYFQESAYRGNLDLVYTSIDNQEVVDANGNPVAGGRRSSATAEIGVNMEADNNFDGSKEDEFNDYITTFDSFLRERPIVWYAGSTSSLVNNTDLLNAIEEFMQ